MTAIGLPNFAPSFSVSCENHGGPGLAAIQQWDAKAQKWSLISDFIKTDSEVIGSLIAEDSAAYAKENKIAPQCS
jgi:branched-chain amino acid transport system substrate-binding protein